MNIRLVRFAALSGYVDVARASGLDPARMMREHGLTRRASPNPIAGWPPTPSSRSWRPPPTPAEWMTSVSDSPNGGDYPASARSAWRYGNSPPCATSSRCCVGTNRCTTSPCGSGLSSATESPPSGWPLTPGCRRHPIHRFGTRRSCRSATHLLEQHVASAAGQSAPAEALGPRHASPHLRATHRVRAVARRDRRLHLRSRPPERQFRPATAPVQPGGP